jgi:hypothetical protein
LIGFHDRFARASERKMKHQCDRRKSLTVGAFLL